MAGLTVSSTPATGQEATARPAAAPEGCDETGSDWDEADIAPGDTRWNPKTKNTWTQMRQKHVLREDTGLRATTYKKGTYVYLYDMKSNQVCRSLVNPLPDGWRFPLLTGYLDNRNTSIQACIKEPGRASKCGEWNREDAGGHRQWDFDGLERLDRNIDPNATVSYDDHEDSEGGRIRPHKYGVSYNHGTRADLMLNGSYGMTYAAFTSRSKNVKVRLDSDKYGKGEWRKPGEQVGEHTWVGYTGILYNDHDRLRIVVKGVHEKPKYGKWFNGTGVG
ncbi:hypothetical protein [Streptomyces muensis]|uniref:Uncharacterized protein n=1 Tax=Streptomyces muensis TaxID=1077944 RepID=A0A9X1TJ11_STRM4|nr:hypothetical protein [Streptomyces muensis]MCF1592104.1 hypothetical protein [Streptomyces muensis]